MRYKSHFFSSRKYVYKIEGGRIHRRLLVRNKYDSNSLYTVSCKKDANQQYIITAEYNAPNTYYIKTAGDYIE